MINEESKNISIGSRIREERERQKKSQLELAQAVGFESATAISLIESGARGVAADMLSLIAKALKVDIKTLLGQKPDQVDVIVALRADKDLGQAEKDYIAKFIENAKRQHGKR